MSESELNELWEEFGMGMSDCNEDERHRRCEVMIRIIAATLTPIIKDYRDKHYDEDYY